MSKCLLNVLLRKSPKISMTFSRAFSCSKCMLANHYDTLKVSPNATAKEIKEAYFKLSKENHPDLHPNDPTCHERFIQLQEAYKVLSNTASRRHYDVNEVNKRSSAYWNTAQRPYENPDFSARDEWIRKQNERIREMKYGEHFGRRADDPRHFYEYYSKPHNMSPEEMDLFLKRKQFINLFRGTNFLIIVVGLFIFISAIDVNYRKKMTQDRYNEMMLRNSQMMARLKDPYYSDARLWEEQDRIARQKMAELEKNLPFAEK